VSLVQSITKRFLNNIQLQKHPAERRETDVNLSILNQKSLVFILFGLKKKNNEIYKRLAWSVAIVILQTISTVVDLAAVE